MSDDVTIRLDGVQYVLRREGDGLQVGQATGGDVTWLDTVDVGLLPARARAALDRGDTSDEALLYAVRGVVQAEVERGG
ncbi:MAG: uncharacterized protein JWP40_634 [Blastococcus sp.]|jgi:hypothetical protein|nr:uncharacterized protein [Blastococcus sp.]